MCPAACFAVLRLVDATGAAANASFAGPSRQWQSPGQTCFSMWHMWSRPNGGRPFPQLWDMETRTGISVPGSQRSDSQQGVSAGPGQVGATAVQYYNGTAGLFLNTTATPPRDNSTLGTVVMGQSWPEAQWYPVWDSPASEAFVRVSGWFRVPQAHRSCTIAHCAVYVVTTLGFHNPASDVFLWYSVSVFDYHRAIGEHVFVDTFSKDIIIQSVYSPTSSYARPVAGSAASTNDTFSDERWFAFDVTANGLHKGLRDADARFNTTLPQDPSGYRLGHFNIENEGTLGVSGGASVRDLRIQVCPDGTCQ